MSHELICTWLGLAAQDGWPPDHYRLLGLERGESDVGRIEEQVHQRLDTVRRYQMMHPEEATEAMNRLAQAFVCLTDPAAKRSYDTTVLGLPAPPEEAAPAPEGPAEPRDPLAWLYTPPPLPEPTPPPLPRSAVPPPLPPPLPAAPPPLPPDWVAGAAAPVAVATRSAKPPPEPRPAEAPPPMPPIAVPPPERPADPVLEAAQTSPQARRGLGTKRALYYRVARTRHLLRLWSLIGRYVSAPRRRLGRGAEAKDLVANLAEIQEVLEHFPPLLGEAGQPGYLVLALTEVDVPATFPGLSASQREALARDWRAGQKLLTAHRDFLRGELRAMRRRGPITRLVRAGRTFLSDQPGVAVLILLALLALGVALWRPYAQELWEALGGHH
jgi:outer membrane biosynthesis protein TonB